jgi:maleylacetoacetate isomerase
MSATLHHFWRSSASWRVRWALAIKGLSFESVLVDIASGEQHKPERLAKSPIGHVPVLELDGHLLTESVAILEYLEETRPTPPLYPRDPWARARVRQLVELVNSGIQPLQNLSVLSRHSSEPAQQKAWARHFNERGLAAYEALLTRIAADGLGGRFSVGDSLTAADLFLVPQVYSARRFGADVNRFPRVLEIEAAAMATEHADGARPEKQPGAPPT